jgi:hypothetical protein
MAKPCRHCKSPARLNPCWWGADHPELVTSGGDPPCLDDAYWEEGRERTRRRTRDFWRVTLGIVVTVAGIVTTIYALRLL